MAIIKIASSKDPPFIPDSLGPATKDLALQCLQVQSELRPTAKELLNHHCFKTPHLQLKQAIT
ncbi:Mitogen-activated protein kinase kinase kinase 1 [Gryllus bimaculatus]|nr:Mitogen-activated protein kinase kinase kinase 1 [Gryllus bimaculatus]